MKKLFTLQLLQGEMIDNIENNMANTSNYVEVAKNETKAAVVYQKKARRVRILAFLILSEAEKQKMLEIMFAIRLVFDF